MKTLFQCAGQFCGSARETGQGGGTERPNKNSSPCEALASNWAWLSLPGGDFGLRQLRIPQSSYNILK
jgi:hypothetical protein